MRVLILGGFGNFGARIARALAKDLSMEVIAAGRNPGASRAGSLIQAVRLNTNAPEFAANLCGLGPDVVIHCAGPFQGQDYRVAEIVLAAGAHYIDLADGREFVTHFAEYNDRRARAAGKLAICGASTLPALSSAVVDHLQPRVWGLEEIQMVIAPGQHAPLGRATIAGVLTYAGRQFDWLLNGRWQPAWGWQELQQVNLSIGSRWASACDVPDLSLFPERYSGLRTVQFRAALEVRAQQLALWLIAMLRSLGLPFPVERWAGALSSLAALFDRFGSDRGGMQVSLLGTQSDGERVRVDWNLVAPANHGPEIPCMAAILLARKLAAGSLAGSGAYAAMGLLSLADFESEFEQWDITSTIVKGAV